jgi:hypothetical protein
MISVRSGGRETDIFNVFRVIIFFLVRRFLVAEGDMLFGLPSVVGLVIAFPLDEAILSI